MNAALAQYALEKRHARQHNAMLGRTTGEDVNMTKLKACVDESAERMANLECAICDVIPEGTIVGEIVAVLGKLVTEFSLDALRPSGLTSLPPDGPAGQIVDNERDAGGTAGEPNR